jgi:hypothetical protein
MRQKHSFYEQVELLFKYWFGFLHKLYVNSSLSLSKIEKVLYKKQEPYLLQILI